MRSALVGYQERIKREQLTRLEIAWHNARWSAFSPKLDSLADVLRQAEGKEEDPDVIWHKMKVWATAYGQVIEEA
ncbi:hypothetical protein IWY39_000597 [Sphingobium sp. JAI105]|uniref:hypothetical protein n=1 Tax=Sphingobium sp. JAI105 TaxID=2787715 RepID=UPI0018CA39D2|nr:hypothetical protein [Sphingobium sp. JAI105]MBG6116793.1 hypothetical protein [Sphingobium sp. JAI105]